MKFAVRKEQKQTNIPYMGNPYIKMIEEQLNDELNNYCVECGNENPEYISINNGIFICVECAQNHFKFPKDISTIINNNIKSLTLNEIQPLLCGGNRALLDFINNEFPKLSEFPPHILYRTQAMIYYRQNLQYLINGGIPPVKPSVKSAYKISNFYQNLNYNNILTSENEYYHTIRQERNLLHNISDIDKYEKFYQSGYNFGKGRINSRNNMNDMNNFDIKFINTLNNGENNYDNYIINKPRQINFQNNNNIIIGNISDNNHSHNQNNDNKILYSPQKIKIDFKQKNKRTKLNKNNKITFTSNSNGRFTSNVNEVYVKPKLLISPKNSNNNINEPINDDPQLSGRTSSVDIIKKNSHLPENNELVERGTIISFQIHNNMNDNWKNRKMNKNLSQRQFYKNQHPINYIKKNKYIHKSLSQKIIKNGSPLLHKNNKTIIFNQTENNNINNNKLSFISNIFNKNNKKCLIDNNKSKIISRKNLKINEKFGNIEQINIIKKVNKNINNNKCLSDQNLKCPVVQCLPIKINLKINKKEKQKENCEKNKKTNNNIDNNCDNDNKVIIKQKEKEKEKENKNGEIKLKLNNLNKKPPKIIKNISQDNILKETKNILKKANEIKIKNIERNTGSIRNKYKIKKQNI